MTTFLVGLVGFADYKDTVRGMKENSAPGYCNGQVVCRWVVSDSHLVYAVPWAIFNTQ